MVQSLAICSVAKNSMKQFCRLFKLTHRSFWRLESCQELVFNCVEIPTCWRFVQVILGWRKLSGPVFWMDNAVHK